MAPGGGGGGGGGGWERPRCIGRSGGALARSGAHLPDAVLSQPPENSSNLQGE